MQLHKYIVKTKRSYYNAHKVEKRLEKANSHWERRAKTEQLLLTQTEQTLFIQSTYQNSSVKWQVF